MSTREHGPQAFPNDRSTAAGARRVLAVNTDRALLGLLEEWLGAHGCEVVPDAADPRCAGNGFDLIVVDVPFPRQGGLEVLKRIAGEHPGSPILAMSASFFADVKSDGAVARALGVAGVVPKPVTRGALLAAVERALRSAESPAS